MNTHAKTLILVAGVLIGIITGYKTLFSSEVAILSLIILISQVILFFINKKFLYKSILPTLFILFFFGLFVGVARVQFVEEKTSFVCEKLCTFNAKIISSPETKNDYQVFRINKLPPGENIYDVQVRVPLYPKYEIGETIKITGKVLEPTIFYPHDGEKVFDYQNYLYTKNVGSEMLYPKIEIINSDTKTFSDSLGRFKENLVSKIDFYISKPASTIASGMLFGNSGMTKELTETFRVAGISHIVVLSGFNIAIVIAFALFVLTFFPLFIRISVASISIVIFVLMVGGEVSVIRATIMAFVTLLAMLIGRQYVAKQALVLSLLLIVMYEPFALLNDVSLHLSFLATAGIVYLGEPLQKLFEKMRSKFFRELFITTLSAYLATFPYIMYTFGTVSVYSLIANILVLPFVPLAMLLSFLVIVFSFISNTISLVFGFVATFVINIIIWIANGVERMPFSSFSTSISFQGVLIFYVCSVLFISYLCRKKENETFLEKPMSELSDIIKY